MGERGGQAYDLDASILQQIPWNAEEYFESRSRIRKFLLGQEAVDGVGEVPADLHHPGFIRAWRDACNLNPARRKFDQEEHVERDETTRSPDLDGEEVGSGEHVPVGLEELAPRRSLAPFRSGVDSVPL